MRVFFNIHSSMSTGEICRKTARVGLSMVGAILISLSASAVPITGEIHFAGRFTPTGGTGLADATGLSFSPGIVTYGDGSFSGLGWMGVTFSSLTFSPLSAPVDPLWAVGGFSFTLESVTVELQSATQLNLTGVGVLSGPGYSPTIGNWSFQGGGGTTFTFRADDVSSGAPGNTGTPVPDGGNASILLGVALMALGAARSFKVLG